MVLPYLLSQEPETAVEEILAGTVDTFYRGQALVIDDQPLNNKLLELSLKNKGIRTVATTSGKTGLVLLQQQQFDIIFCDLHMPEMDGKQVIQAMRQDPWVVSHQIPIIAFTANVLPQERAQYEALGVSDFLFKPFSHRDLDTLLAVYLPSALSDEQPQLSVEAPTYGTYTLAGVKQFTGEDEGLLIDYLENFVRSYSASVERLQEALQERNAAGLSFYAHKMVSHAELLKHHELTALLKKLERLSERSRVTDEVSEDVEQAIHHTTQLVVSMQHETERLSQQVAS